MFASSAYAGDLRSFSTLRASGRFFRDEKNAVVFLRGVAFSGAFKTPDKSGKFTTKYRASDLDPVVDWGTNVVRLSFFWEAYEPEKGKYDETYLDWYADIVADAAKRGIRVVLDFHQDAFSRYSINGCGAGFPKWTVIGPTASPDNSEKCAPWGTMALFDTQLGDSFRNLYAGKDGENGVRARLLLVWRKLAEKFKYQPALIGFDLLNEPLGNWETELLPLYADIAQVVQNIAPKKILFLEPNVALVKGSESYKKPDLKNFAFTPHYYDIRIVLTGREFEDRAESDIADLARLSDHFNSPVFVDEFSSPFSAGDAKRIEKLSDAEREKLGEKRMAYVDKLYRGFDRELLSAVQWTYCPTWNPKDLDGWNAENVSIVDDKGNLRHFRPRPYAQRVAGTPVAMRDNVTDKSFALEWDNDPKAGETVVFAPKAGKFALLKMGKFEVTPADMKCAHDAARILVSCKSEKTGRHKLLIR